MKKIFKSILMLAIVISICSYTVLGASSVNYVNYDNSRNLTRNGSGGAYETVFYDYGTKIPGDNARTFAKSYGNTKNAAVIRFADYGTTSFETQTSNTYKNKLAYINYTSSKDYLQPGSFSKALGFIEFVLNITE
ncbi:hypothetical protein HMPREF9709_00593 [Helcococcus kunzii ATCC 51366]|uniref:Uncharacterized protein n=1 Tax=Helcococcus kunzii ATCC 51366 TaxID=883114 RepID=H3NMN2_9FIRM|nr:hypothetical protein [Helcococcus kunzii]EHR34776.1 hypothetical protein HMPREF9709_00593 [Helcococcus kunzii ATCC 51366]